LDWSRIATSMLVSAILGAAVHRVINSKGIPKAFNSGLE
jgi:hypothetical protein